MAVLGDRATGILDALIESFRDQSMPNQQLAPTMRGQGTVLLPELVGQVSPPAVATIETNPALNQAPSMPLGQGVARTADMPAVMPAQPQQTIEPNRLISGRSLQAGQGVMQTGMDREAMLRAGKIADDAIKSGDESLISKVQEFFGGRENMLRLAMAFNTMRLQPDAGLASALSSELKDVRATRMAKDQQNRTAAYFDAIDPKIAAAIRGGLSAKDAIALYRDRERGVVVGKMIVNPTTGDVIYDGTEEDSELPATFRALQLRAEEAGLQKGTEAYRQFFINAGQRAGLSIKTNPDGTFEITEGGVTSKTKALTEGQGKATQFAQRMSASQRIINTVEGEGTSIFNAIVGNIPLAGNLLTSPDYKLYEQAKRDFVNAVLRYESGAAIGASEFESADRQYFPQPGDTAEVIAQKRRNRDLAIATMQAVSGPQAEEYAKNIRVQLFGPEAANWPAVGTVEEGMMYKGGDPAIESNWEAVR